MAKIRADLILRQIAKQHVGNTRMIDDVTFTQINEIKEKVKLLELQIKKYERDVKTLRAIQQIAINAGCNYRRALISDIEKAVENLRRSIKLERRLDK